MQQNVCNKSFRCANKKWLAIIIQFKMIGQHGFQLNATQFFMQTVCVDVAAVILMDATKKMISVSRLLAVLRSLKLQI